MSTSTDPRRSAAAKKGWETRRNKQRSSQSKKRSVVRRGFDASLNDTLLSRWTTRSLNINQEIRDHLAVLRGRSQDLYKNSEYVNRFVNLLVQNVVGPQGIRLQVKAQELNGEIDRDASEAVETIFRKWCKKGSASVDGRMSFLDLQQLALKTVIIDGEVFFRKVKIDGEFRLQPFLSQHIDERFSDPRKGIEMGIQMDSFRRPTAYWVTVQRETKDSVSIGGLQRLKIPAKEMLHLYRMDRPDQIRGIPWTVPVMRQLKILDGYQEAELVAARTAAAKMGFLVTPTGDEFAGDGQNDDGSLIMDAEPGSITQLPEGMHFENWSPDHPTSAFKDFVKTTLRAIASGLNVSYNCLASDLEGVNFSSIRQGVLDDRDSYRVLQNWLIESLHTPVYESWLENALLRGKIAVGGRTVTFSSDKLEKFSHVNWQPRGWGWVDPKKDVESNLLSVRMGVKSLTEVAAEQGRDLEETLEQLKREKELLAQAGVTLPEVADVFTSPGDKEDETEEEARLAS